MYEFLFKNCRQKALKHNYASMFTNFPMNSLLGAIPFVCGYGTPPGASDLLNTKFSS